MFDTTRIRQKNDLMAIVSGDAPALKRVASTDGGEWAGPCPFCGGTDRFRVQPNAPYGGRWLCRTCTDGCWQDVIAYVMRRDRKDFVEACGYLGAERYEKSGFTPAPIAGHVVIPPPAKWQSRAGEVVAEFEDILWLPEGRRALDWLHKRGLKDNVLIEASIGFNPTTRYESMSQWGLPDEVDEKGKPKAVYIPRGIVIPGRVNQVPWYLKVRRPAGEPKYLHIRGSRPALYLSGALEGREAAILTEGELDALLLWQEAADQLGVATFGSAKARIDLALWGQRLQLMKRLLVAYDADPTGREGAQKITEVLPNAKVVKVPVLQPGHKDITDYHCAGGSLKDWVTFLLRRHSIRPSG